MSSNERDSKKRRKRKTRAERNQLIRHHHLDAEKQKKYLIKGKKTSDQNLSQNSTTYSLRSSKSLAMPCLLPKDLIRPAVVNITQGRLTRPLTTFDNAISSAWSRRVPVTEKEEVKRSEDNEMRDFLNMTGLGNKSNNSDKSPVKTACNRPNSEAGQHKSMEPDTCPQRSPTVREEGHVMPQPSPANTTPAFSDISPQTQEEVLAPEPPIQEIADSIMNELKPKFGQMFPNRDVELENCCDLEKLLQRRSRGKNLSSIQNIYPIEVSEEKTPLSSSRLLPFVECAQPVSQPMRMSRELRQRGQRSSMSPSPGPESGIFGSMLQGIQSKRSKKLCERSGLLITNIEDEDGREEEKIITLKLDNEDDDREEGGGSPSIMTVSYKEFVDSAREMKLKLEQQQQLMQFSNVMDMSSPAHVNIFSKSIPNTDIRQTCSHHSCWNVPCRRAARTLDFFQPKGCQCYEDDLPSKFIEQNFYTHHHHKDYPSDVTHHPFQHSTNFTTSGHNSDSTSIFEIGSFGSDNAVHCRDMQDHFLSPNKSSRSRGLFGVGHSLAQSRYNFQEALNTACRMSDARKAKSTYARHPLDQQPMEKVCYGACRDVKDKRSYIGSGGSLSSYSILEPRIELQDHKADLQRQAKDFLDNLVYY